MRVERQRPTAVPPPVRVEDDSAADKSGREDERAGTRPKSRLVPTPATSANPSTGKLRAIWEALGSCAGSAPLMAPMVQ